MSLTWFIPALLGTCSALQGIVNKRIMGDVGLPTTVLLNMLVLAVITVVWFAFARPSDLGGHLGEAWSKAQWWWIVGGIAGFLITSLLPVSITHLGAATTFVLFVVFQIGAGLVWDIAASGRVLSLPQIVSIVAALGGVIGLTVSSRS